MVSVVWNTAEANALLVGPGSATTRYLLKVGLRVESAAKRRCPVDTGRLRMSIQTMIAGRDEVRVGSNVYYAEFVHDGTRYMEGRPFLADALAEVVASL